MRISPRPMRSPMARAHRNRRGFLITLAVIAVVTVAVGGGIYATKRYYDTRQMEINERQSLREAQARAEREHRQASERAAAAEARRQGVRNATVRAEVHSQVMGINVIDQLTERTDSEGSSGNSRDPRLLRNRFLLAMQPMEDGQRSGSVTFATVPADGDRAELGLRYLAWDEAHDNDPRHFRSRSRYRNNGTDLVPSNFSSPAFFTTNSRAGQLLFPFSGGRNLGQTLGLPGSEDPTPSLPANWREQLRRGTGDGNYQIRESTGLVRLGGQYDVTVTSNRGVQILPRRDDSGNPIFLGEDDPRRRDLINHARHLYGENYEQLPSRFQLLRDPDSGRIQWTTNPDGQVTLQRTDGTTETTDPHILDLVRVQPLANGSGEDADSGDSDDPLNADDVDRSR